MSFFKVNDHNKIILREGSRNIIFWATFGYLLSFVGSVLILVWLITEKNDSPSYIGITAAGFIGLGIICLIIKNVYMKSWKLVQLDFLYVGFFIVLMGGLGFVFWVLDLTTLGRLQSILVAFTFYPAYKSLITELKMALKA